MAATTDLRIKNNDSNYEYLFRAVTNFRDSFNQDVIQIPLIHTAPANTFLFRFMGQGEEVTFDFAIFNDDVDTANGTYTSQIKTITAQINYLKQVIFVPDFDVNFTLYDNNSRFFANMTGVITKLEFGQSTGAGTIVTATMAFKRGRVGLL